MEEGSLRVDANVSLRAAGTDELGTRCEVTNLNSLRSLMRAMSTRPIGRRRCCRPATPSRRRPVTGTRTPRRTHSLRSKEEAYDYRYFPEPDLVPVVPDAALFTAAAEGVGLCRPSAGAVSASWYPPGESVVAGSAAADVIQTVIGLDLDSLVLAAVAAGADATLALNRAANDAASRSEVARSLDPRAFAAVIRMESSGQLSATQAKTVLGEMLDSGGEPGEIAKRLGFEAMGSSELDSAVESVIAAHPAEWERYLGGDREGGRVSCRAGDEGHEGAGERQARGGGVRRPALTPSLS